MRNHSTNENNADVVLKTHWYRDGYPKVKAAILEVADAMQMDIISVNDEYMEIYVGNARHRITLKVTTYRVMETSIDLYIESLSPFDFFGWKKVIEVWYINLGKKLMFIGTSLHP